MGTSDGDNRGVGNERINVGVVGGGSWGTALAAHLSAHDVTTVLWAREPEVVDGINAEHRNHLFLSDVALPVAAGRIR